MDEYGSKQRVPEYGHAKEYSRVGDSNFIIDALVHNLVENSDSIARIVMAENVMVELES